MKKARFLLALALTGMMITTLAGCGAKEEGVTNYTSVSGNMSVDLPGKGYEEKSTEDNAMNLNNGKLAFGIIQFPKHVMEANNVYSFDDFVSWDNASMMQALNIDTSHTENVEVTAPNMIASSAKKYDLTDSLGTQCLIMFGETDKAYYQFMTECRKKDFNVEKFSTAFSSLQELKVDEEDTTTKTYTSDSGQFSIDLPGTWQETDTGAGTLFMKGTAGNVVLKLEKITKEQAASVGAADLDQFVDVLNSMDGTKALADRSTVTEETFDPGKYKAAKAFLYDSSADDGMKQLFVYLESDDSYISFNLGASAKGYDTEYARYADVVQSLVEQ